MTLKLDAQIVARYMRKNNKLKQRELESIQAIRKEPTKAAEKLLNIFIQESLGVDTCFLEALQQTGHKHVYGLIKNGDSTGSYETK